MKSFDSIFPFDDSINFWSIGAPGRNKYEFTVSSNLWTLL